MNKLQILIALALLFASISCKRDSIRFKSRDTKAFQVEELDFDYFDARSKVRFVEGDRQVNGYARIRIRKDSLIWFSVSPPVGLEVTRALITPDTIWILNRLDKEFYIFNYKEISRYFNFDINFQLIQSMVLGNLPKPISAKSRVAKNQEYYMVKQDDDKFNIESYVNLENRKVETVMINEVPTNNMLMLNYTEFKELEQYLFPYNCLVNLTYKTKDGQLITSLNLQYNKAEISDKPLKFPFNVPNKYEEFK